MMIIKRLKIVAPQGSHLDLRYWSKFEKFLAEGGTLEPIVNNETKVNTKEEESNIKSDPKLKYEMDGKLALHRHRCT